MKKWEYTVVSFRGCVLWADDINPYGDRGWELVAAFKEGEDYTCVFKRAKEEF